MQVPTNIIRVFFILTGYGALSVLLDAYLTRYFEIEVYTQAMVVMLAAAVIFQVAVLLYKQSQEVG